MSRWPSSPSPRDRQQHRVDQSLLFAPLRVESREGVGEAQEVGAALLLGFEQCAQGVGAASGLKEHRCVDAVEGGSLAGGGQALVRDIDASEYATAAAPPADFRGRLQIGEEHPLERACADRRLLLKPRGHRLRAVLAEELSGTLGDRQQAYDALLRLDDAAFPLGKLDAERLRETAHDIEDQREALGLAAGGAFFVVVPVGWLLVLALVVCVLRRLAIRALERPEEERREPRVLLDGAGGAVAGFGLGGAEHLSESASPHDFPDLLHVLRKRDLAPFG